MAPAAAGALQEMEACQRAGGASIMDVMYTQGKEVYYRNEGGALRQATHSAGAEFFFLHFFSTCQCGRLFTGIHKEVQV